MTTGIDLRAVFGLFVLAAAIYQTQALTNRTVTGKVFLEITIDDYPAGRFVMGLFGNDCPKTVANFLALCQGTPGYGYKGNMFHRIIKDFVIQGGDIVNGDGTGFISIYGGEFPDENLSINHFKNCVNMANKGKDTNGSQFAILTTKASWLNGKHVVFGVILDGFNLIRRLETLATNGLDHPIPSPVISSCGVIDVPAPYIITVDD